MDGFLTGLASFLSKSCFLTFLSVPSDLKWKIWSSNSSSKWQVHFQIRQIRTHFSYIEKFSFWVECWETSPTQNTLRRNQPLTWSKLWKLWGIYHFLNNFWCFSYCQLVSVRHPRLYFILGMPYVKNSHPLKFSAEL